jgi:hypothetical protein
MEIKGRPATIWLSLPSDLLIGESTLEIKDDLLIEKRKVRLIGKTIRGF